MFYLRIFYFMEESTCLQSSQYFWTKKTEADDMVTPSSVNRSTTSVFLNMLHTYFHTFFKFEVH